MSSPTAAAPSKFWIETPDTFDAFGHLINHLENHGIRKTTVETLRGITERKWNVMRQRQVKDGDGKTAWTKKLIQDGIATLEGRKALSTFDSLVEQFKEKLKAILKKQSLDPSRLAVFQSFVNGLPHSRSVLVDCLKASLLKLDADHFSELYLAGEGNESVEGRITSYLLSIKSSVDLANRASGQGQDRYLDLAENEANEVRLLCAKTLKNEWCIIWNKEVAQYDPKGAFQLPKFVKRNSSFHSLSHSNFVYSPIARTSLRARF